jgi:hypothetical protein
MEEQYEMGEEEGELGEPELEGRWRCWRLLMME